MRLFHISFLALVIVICLVGTQLFTESTKVTSYIANTLFKNNFHEVVPHRFYRAAEMSHDELAETIRKNGIKTVIDLRLGKEEPDSNGIVESQTAKGAGAEYKHVALRSTSVPERTKIEELIQAYNSAEPPVLVHCSSGTHRSGVASAIWLMTKEGRSVEEAKKQLSSEYGYFRFERAIKSWFSGRPTIDNLLWQFAKVSAGTGMSFQDWVNTMPTDVVSSGNNVSNSGIRANDETSESSQ